MLRRPQRLSVAAVLVVAAYAGAAASASADVDPCQGDFVCVSTGTTTSPAPAASTSVSGGSSDSGQPVCSWNGLQWPCYDKDLGWFDNADGCYWRAEDPPPAAGDPAWDGHAPGDGVVYERNCRGTGGSLNSAPPQWSKNPPPGMGGGIDLPGLALQAADKMRLTGPTIGMAPAPGSTGLVGMPVWMWTSVSPTTWGPNTASASAGGTTVTATAHASRIDWSMGDGHSVSCTVPGTPYDSSYGGRKSPDCGFDGYAATSAGQPHGQFHITATTTWTVDWTGSGQSGQLTLTRTSAADVAVAQAQAVVKP